MGQSPFPKIEHKTDLIEIIHSDLSSPMRTSYHGMSKYFMTSIGIWYSYLSLVFCHCTNVQIGVVSYKSDVVVLYLKGAVFPLIIIGGDAFCLHIFMTYQPNLYMCD